MAKKKNGAKSGGNVAETVRRLAEPIADAAGVFVWDVRFVKEGADWFLRVYIDKMQEAVSIDDCVTVSRQLSDVLDAADPIPHSYCLEVSSPGIERELTRPEHFDMFEGAAVVVKLFHAAQGEEREFAGILNGLNDDGVLQITDIDDNVLTFNRKEIASVHLLEDDEDCTNE